jgi:hypothetical protein
MTFGAGAVIADADRAAGADLAILGIGLLRTGVDETALALMAALAGVFFFEVAVLRAMGVLLYV